MSIPIFVMCTIGTIISALAVPIFGFVLKDSALIVPRISLSSATLLYFLYFFLVMLEPEKTALGEKRKIHEFLQNTAGGICLLSATVFGISSILIQINNNVDMLFAASSIIHNILTLMCVSTTVAVISSKNRRYVKYWHTRLYVFLHSYLTYSVIVGLIGYYGVSLPKDVSIVAPYVFYTIPVSVCEVFVQYHMKKSLEKLPRLYIS